MKECAARHSYMISVLYSPAAQLIISLCLACSTPSLRLAEKRANRKNSQQKLEDVQDFIKIQDAKSSLLAAMMGHFVSCLISQNIYHITSDLSTELQRALFLH